MKNITKKFWPSLTKEKKSGSENLPLITCSGTSGAVIPIYQFVTGVIDYCLKSLDAPPEDIANCNNVAYHVQETNWKDNEFVRQIWIHDVAGDRSYQLTRGRGCKEAPTWSPDGRQLAFEWARGDSIQIWAMGLDGSRQRMLTNNGNNLTPAWSARP